MPFGNSETGLLRHVAPNGQSTCELSSRKVRPEYPRNTPLRLAMSYFKAPPTTLMCTKCGWKRTIIPSGSVLMILPCCLKCGNGSLTHHRASKVEEIKARLGSLLTRQHPF